MKSEKKSFLDNFRCIDHLSHSQLGALFSALCQYAMASAEGGPDHTMKPSEMLNRCPDMDDPTRMAFAFIADTVYRDTVKWKEKHERYSEAAKGREEKKRSREDVISQLRSGTPRSEREEPCLRWTAFTTMPVEGDPEKRHTGMLSRKKAKKKGSLRVFRERSRI